MASKKADQKYRKLIQKLKDDPNVLAFWLFGSRGKGMITAHSDYDLSVIVKDKVKKSYEKKYTKDFQDPEFDISVRTVDELKKHAAFGSEMAWDRYNFAYVKVLFDRTGKIQKNIDGKSIISEKEKKQIINGGLDNFINQVYRAAKCKRDGDPIAAQLEAAEAVPCFLDCIFALEGRIKPFHKYLAWDLKKHPLKKLPWSGVELIKKLMKVIKDGDQIVLLELFQKTRPIFQKAGYGKIYEGWKGKYVVGK